MYKFFLFFLKGCNKKMILTKILQSFSNLFELENIKLYIKHNSLEDILEVF